MFTCRKDYWKVFRIRWFPVTCPSGDCAKSAETFATLKARNFARGIA